MKFEKGILERIKITEEIEEGPEYTILDKARYPNRLVGNVVESMTGKRPRYPGDIAFGVKEISRFYKALGGDIEKPGKPQRLNYPEPD